MANKKAQVKAGVPEKRRGQQMGDERSKPSKIEEAQAQTPASRGRLKSANKFFADDSFQQTGTRGESRRDNSPSVPAAVPTQGKIGESDGEAEFKARQKATTKSTRKARR